MLWPLESPDVNPIGRFWSDVLALSSSIHQMRENLLDEQYSSRDLSNPHQDAVLVALGGHSGTLLYVGAWLCLRNVYRQWLCCEGDPICLFLIWLFYVKFLCKHRSLQTSLFPFGFEIGEGICQPLCPDNGQCHEISNFVARFSEFILKKREREINYK